MNEPSQLYRLVEERLDGSLAELIQARRPATSWRDISTEIEQATGISVSHEALRLWFADRITVQVNVA